MNQTIQAVSPNSADDSVPRRTDAALARGARPRWRFGLAAAVVLAVIPGCFGLDQMVSHSSPIAKAPTGNVAQVQAMWENHVITTQDVVNNGRPLVGLAGQVYFFGEDIGYPLGGKGTLTVDAREFQPDGTAKLIERWEIDPATLAKLGRKDRIGWGYTVFLPWSTFRPDITRLQLQLKFVPETGIPIFSTPTTVSLTQEGPPVITSNIVPAAGTRK